MELKTTFYEDWMKEQIIILICDQYGYKIEDYQDKFSNFYETDFQKTAIKVVVLNGDIVVGFMGFFYWPYNYQKKIFKSYQAGNVIVHPEYRGQGIFHKMVNFMNDNYKEKNVELLMGFPVTAAFNTYIRNGWENLLNLQWYIKINNPLSPLFPLKLAKIEQQFKQKKSINLNSTPNRIALLDTPNFNFWREKFYKTKKFYYTYTKGNVEIQFGLKLNVRKKIINELIIGEISISKSDPEIFADGLKSLLKQIRKLKAISIVSIAMNPNDLELKTILKKRYFRKINKQIFFVVKNFTTEKNINNKSLWTLFRGDLDTW